MRRRDALVIGGAMAVAIAIPPLLRRIPTEFEFTPVPGFAGFRRLDNGPTSGGVDPFFGLGTRLPDQAPLDDSVSQNPCMALFGPDGWGDTLPIALFTDVNCPYCKVLEARLIGLRDRGAPIRLIWHEMPLLGPASIRAARAVLAARFLGLEAPARAYLASQTLRPGTAAIDAFAEALGVSGAVMQPEIEGHRVSEALATSLALGARLGIPGTPGTVVGRTLVVGAIRDADLDALIEIERDTPQNVCL